MSPDERGLPWKARGTKRPLTGRAVLPTSQACLDLGPKRTSPRRMRLEARSRGAKTLGAGGPRQWARSVVTRDHDADDRTAAISMRCGRSAAGARPHRPPSKAGKDACGAPALFRHAAFGWRPRWSRRRTGDRCRGPAPAGRGRDRTHGSAVNAAACGGSSFAGKARMASTTAEFGSVTRRPRSAKFTAARRAPAPRRVGLNG